jgi:DNA-binding PadR family transcriptional regulator
MVDFDPRDRDDDRRDLDVQWVELGRGSSSGGADDDGGVRHQDAGEREREPRDRSTDPREVFGADLDLPRSRARELVLQGRDRYELNRDDVRTLATVGAFRVVPERQLSDGGENSLPDLRDQGLVRVVSVNAHDRVVTLTERGRQLLESHRRDRHDSRQQGFYAGVSRMRELSHDSKLYAAYLREANRLREQCAHIHRILLDAELKRVYQQWLQDHNRGRSDTDGRPDRDSAEIEQWAREHGLPCFDGSVQFPDFRIEYELDHVQQHRDVEVMTGNYRGAHAASRARSGFTCVGGRNRGGGHPFDPDAAGDYV